MNLLNLDPSDSVDRREIAQLREHLEMLHYADNNSFRQLFWLRAHVHETELIAPLHKFGLLHRGESGRINATVQISFIEGNFVITDWPEYPGRNRVFPIFSDENLLLCEFLKHIPAESALDIGTGSGVVAIQLASRVNQICATEISPRAIRFARINARLNRCDQRVRFSRSNVFESSNRRYDLICSNPPFAPVPPEAGFHLAGDGGTNGTRVIRQIFRDVSAHLHGGSIIVLVAVSLCSAEGPLVERIARSSLPDMEVTATSIYGTRLSLDAYCNTFRQTTAVAKWQASLIRNGFDSLTYIILVASRSRIKVRIPTIEHSRFSGTWDARLARYGAWQRQP